MAYIGICIPSTIDGYTTSFIFFTWKPLSDWKRPPGRPNHTWLRAIESYPRPLNIGPSYPWKKPATRERWRSIVDTATLKKSMWKTRDVCLHVCLSCVCPRREHISGTICTWTWLGLPLVALWYIMYFRLYEWRYDAQNAAFTQSNWTGVSTDLTYWNWPTWEQHRTWVVSYQRLPCWQGIAPGAARRYAPRRWQFDGGKNRGGSTSVRGRVRTSLVAGGG